MSSRLRDRRRKEQRAPAIWHGAVAAETGERSAVQHGSRGRSRMSWRLVSLLLIISLSIVLALFFSSNAFYVHSVSVGGLRYLTKEEIFTYANIANLHVFWIDPDQVRRNIMREPTVADARVYIAWPPNMVQIIIEEREPALIWIQSGVAVWVDLRGRVMQLREDRSDLPRVLVDDIDGDELGLNVQVPSDVVNGVLQLAELLPGVDGFRYNANKGLGYNHPNGWQVWFGVGMDMPEKLLIYEAVERDVVTRGIVPYEINVVNPDAPYYCIDGSACSRRGG
jgi:hypothetical protein